MQTQQSQLMLLMVYYDLCHLVYLKIDRSQKYRALKYSAENLTLRGFKTLN